MSLSFAHKGAKSVFRLVPQEIKSAPGADGSGDGDNLVGELRCGDDIEHVRGSTHFFPVREVKVLQAGAACQNYCSLFLVLHDL